MAKKDTRETFIAKAIAKHGNRFDYSKVEYIDCHTKVCIIDHTKRENGEEYGEFWQLPYVHLQGCVSTTLGNERKKEKLRHKEEVFIRKAQEIHPGKYDYSLVNYVNNKTKVCIICKQCGNRFWQTPNNHLKGAGCPLCGHKTKDFQSLINQCNTTHRQKYDYSQTDYRRMSEEVRIICPEHGEFWQKFSDHIRGEGCPVCGKRISKAENEIVDYLRGLGCECETRNRKLLNGDEIDIYLPSLKLAIEYNGLHWHSEEFCKDANYHLNKTKECERLGIRLMHIFEDEWLSHKDFVLTKLRHIVGKNNGEKVFARKCTVMPIDRKTAEIFLEANHIQGFASATIYLGAFYKKGLVAVMTLKETDKENKKWELTRFATALDKRCVGLGGKMFSFFQRNYDFSEVKSFADRRWSTTLKENLYTRLGFKLEEILRPNYKYVTPGSRERHHKFAFRKQILHKKFGLPLTMTEKEMTMILGYHRIWDCGLLKYVFKNEKQCPRN